MKNKNFYEPIQSNDKVFESFNHMKFCLFGDACFNYFVLQNTAKKLDLNGKNKFLRNFRLISFT